MRNWPSNLLYLLYLLRHLLLHHPHRNVLDLLLLLRAELPFLVVPVVLVRVVPGFVELKTGVQKVNGFYLSEYLSETLGLFWCSSRLRGL